VDELVFWKDMDARCRRFEISFDAREPLPWLVQVHAAPMGGEPSSGTGRGGTLNFAAVRALIDLGDAR